MSSKLSNCNFGRCTSVFRDGQDIYQAPRRTAVVSSKRHKPPTDWRAEEH